MNMATPEYSDAHKGGAHDESARHGETPAGTTLGVIGTPPGGSLPYC
ncbi:MAG TPA: hypothetical protein VED66_08355 [Candidatus Sulfotelmatobacter sp.]|nr:hypothetical protein [Candidatus Sulfotelmatobacter sp.]